MVILNSFLIKFMVLARFIFSNRSKDIKKISLATCLVTSQLYIINGQKHSIFTIVFFSRFLPFFFIFKLFQFMFSFRCLLLISVVKSMKIFFFFNIYIFLGFSLYFTVVCLCHITGGIPPPSGGIVGKNRSTRIIWTKFIHFKATRLTLESSRVKSIYLPCITKKLLSSRRVILEFQVGVKLLTQTCFCCNKSCYLVKSKCFLTPIETRSERFLKET